MKTVFSRQSSVISGAKRYWDQQLVKTKSTNVNDPEKGAREVARAIVRNLLTSKTITPVKEQE